MLPSTTTASLAVLLGTSMGFLLDLPCDADGSSPRPERTRPFGVDLE
jgi:hypothetical protein